MKPLALVIRTAGTNCDGELAYAFELAGAAVQVVHLNRLIETPDLLAQANLIGVPGGFSYGDDIAAGRIFANRLRHQLLDSMKDAIARGVPVIGICNGFQVLVKLGLLPDLSGDRLGQQATTLCDNIGGRFIARWVKLEVPCETPCVWTRGLRSIELPIAHGEGRFVPGSCEVLERLEGQHQIALRYAPPETGGLHGPRFIHGGCENVQNPLPHSRGSLRSTANLSGSVSCGGNPNGSVGDIAGICDPSGLVLGLMPHPERYLHTTHHPFWTQGSANQDQSPRVPAGLRMFQNAVEHAKRSAGGRVAAVVGKSPSR